MTTPVHRDRPLPGDPHDTGHHGTGHRGTGHRGTGHRTVDDAALRRALADEEADWAPVRIDPTRVSPARVYDYLLDGKDNFEADRAAAEQALAVMPYGKALARANRDFLHRAVRYVVHEQGIRQLVDLGTGIPTSPSVHEIAQAIAPEARVLYLDNDPVVLTHNRALLATEPGTVTLLRDLRDPDSVIDDGTVRRLIDFDEPVGLLFFAVLHFVPFDQAPALMARYRSVLAPGSCIAVSAACRDGSDPTAVRTAEAVYDNSDSSLYVRTRAQVEQLFEGFDLPEPLDDVTRWRNPGGRPMAMRALAGVGVKP